MILEGKEKRDHERKMRKENEDRWAEILKDQKDEGIIFSLEGNRKSKRGGKDARGKA